MKTTLFKAIEFSNLIAINGYEIDDYSQFYEDKDGFWQLSCGDDEYFKFKDQDVELEHGSCSARGHVMSGNVYEDEGELTFMFQVTRLLSDQDFG